MKQRFLYCAAVVSAGLALIAGAGEGGPEPLPEGVGGFVSIAHPRQFLDDVFAYAEKATEGTERPVSAEVLGMMAGMFIPVPFDAWKAEEELRLFFVGEDWRPFAVFSVASFGEFVDGLAGAGWEVEPEELEVKAPFVAARTVFMPGGRVLTAADLGDGRAVLAENHDSAGAALGKVAERGSGADMVARIRIAGGLDEIRGEIAKRIADGAENFVGQIADAGLTEEIGRWMIRMAEKYGDRAGAEIMRAEEVRIDLGFDGARADLGVAALFGDGSWTRKLAETLERREALPEGDLLALLPEGYYTGTAAAPFPQIVPDAESAFVEFAADFAELVPDRKDALQEINRAFFSAGPGRTANAGYYNNGNSYTISLTDYDDPQAALDAALAFVEALGAAAEMAFADPAEGIALPVEKHSEGGLEWHEWRVEPVDAERFGEFVAKNAGESILSGTWFVPEPDFRVFLARLDGNLVTVSGSLDREEFVGILKGIAETSASANAVSPFDAPEVKPLLDSLGAAQALRGLLDLEEVCLLSVILRLEMMKKNAAPGRGLSDWILPGMEAALEDLETERIGDAGIALGAGAEDGRVALRFAVPASAVNTAVKMHERFSAKMLAEARRLAAEAAAAGDAAGKEEE